MMDFKNLGPRPAPGLFHSHIHDGGSGSKDDSKKDHLGHRFRQKKDHLGHIPPCSLFPKMTTLATKMTTLATPMKFYISLIKPMRLFHIYYSIGPIDFLSEMSETRILLIKIAYSALQNSLKRQRQHACLLLFIGQFNPCSVQLKNVPDCHVKNLTPSLQHAAFS